jgi:rhamnosyltransferase subunit B
VTRQSYLRKAPQLFIIQAISKVSIEAARQLGRRAVLLGAKTVSEVHRTGILVLPYVPYSQIFPPGVVNVHQGGSGTTGQALKAGRPMLVVPYGWDQSDNAARIERLGTGLHVSRNTYSLKTATSALQRLLCESHFANRAREIGAQMQDEDGLTLACDAVESILYPSGFKWRGLSNSS